MRICVQGGLEQPAGRQRVQLGPLAGEGPRLPGEPLVTCIGVGMLQILEEQPTPGLHMQGHAPFVRKRPAKAADGFAWTK